MCPLKCLFYICPGVCSNSLSSLISAATTKIYRSNAALSLTESALLAALNAFSLFDVNNVKAFRARSLSSVIILPVGLILLDQAVISQAKTQDKIGF